MNNAAYCLLNANLQKTINKGDIMLRFMIMDTLVSKENRKNIAKAILLAQDYLETSNGELTLLDASLKAVNSLKMHRKLMLIVYKLNNSSWNDAQYWANEELRG